jgi:uncharacterized protein
MTLPFLFMKERVMDKTLIDRMDNDLKAAMKSGDRTRLETLRSLRAALKEKEIALRGKKEALDTDDVLTVLTTAAKQRKEAIQEYAKAGRPDRADAETKELEIILEYLPAQMTDEEIEKTVRNAMEKTNAASIGDIGRVMSAVMPEVKGRADGKAVQAVVRRMLGG